METTRFFHLSPTSAVRARLEEAEHYFLLGNMNEALAAAQQAWRECPTDSDVFRVLAYVHMARGEYPPAAQSAYQAVKIDGDNPASYATLAQVYITFNMLQLAEQTLNAALASFSDNPSILSLFADLLFRRKQTDRAVDLATQALQRNPGDSYAKALLGTHYLQKKRYELAEPFLAEAVKVYSQRWDYLRDYGIALLHQGKPALAREALSRAFKLNPADLSLKRHLHFALRFTEGRMGGWHQLAFFFFNQSGLGWTMALFGAVCCLIGFCWGMSIIGDNSFYEEIPWPVAFFLGGVALMVLSGPGLLATIKGGRGFDIYLWKKVDQPENTPGGQA